MNPQRFNIVIPNGQNVTFDVDEDNSVTALTLGSGSTLTISAEDKNLLVADSAMVAGDIRADGGSFTALGAANAFTGNSRMFAVDGGQIAFSPIVSAYQGTHYNDQTIFQAIGADALGSGSMLDLSTLETLQTTDSRGGNTSWLTVHAANGGVIDLSGLTNASNVGGDKSSEANGASGNFAIGRLVVGEPESPTTVALVDLFDNGNRDENGREALYLNGLGGLGGLEINPGSILVIGAIPTYAMLDGQMTNLNTLFGPEVIGMPLGAGILALTQPEPGDFDLNGKVDDDDLAVWSEDLGQSTGALLTDGDADLDGDVDGFDFLAWQRSFSATSAVATNSIPEPHSLLLFSLAALTCMSSRFRPLTR